jgi:hypothetical protein
MISFGVVLCPPMIHHGPVFVSFLGCYKSGRMWIGSKVGSGDGLRELIQRRKTGT